MDDKENLAPTGIRSQERPSSSQSLYRLRYPVGHFTIKLSKMQIIIIIIIIITITTTWPFPKTHTSFAREI